MITLGIETSCDETSVAIVKDGRLILSNIIYSSLEQHQPYGGVVPEIASRSHVEVILPCLEASIKKAKLGLKRVDLIAATSGPGLMGSLLVGFSAAKALAFALGKPFIGVDHVIAHVYAGFLSDLKLKFPCLGLVVSGGHTLLLRMDSPARVDVLGRSLDDAAGEAFDKVAKILGLGYPGGPEIDRLSRGVDPKKVIFSRPFLSKNSLDFSFSGIKTAVYYHVLRSKSKPTLKDKKEICSGFQEAVCDVLVRKTMSAAESEGLRTVIVGGGVSANSRLRQMMLGAAKKAGLKVIFPEMGLCQDNAAMIAAYGAALYKAGYHDPLSLGAYAQFSERKQYADQ